MGNICNAPAVPITEWSDAEISQFRAEFLSKLDSLDTIKPLPTAAVRLMEGCRNPDKNIAELVSLIESDPAIAIRVMTAANSPLFGQSRLINTIQHAVVVLGFNAIAQMASAFATMSVFLDAENDNPKLYFQRERLFHHSLGCAAVARSIAAQINSVDPGEAYLAGALHDVGKLIFLELAPSPYQQLMMQTQGKIQIEKEVFGITHEELGQMCADKWGLSDDISVAIGFHHHPDNAPFNLELVQIIESANHYSIVWGIGEDQEDAAGNAIGSTPSIHSAAFEVDDDSAECEDHQDADAKTSPCTIVLDDSAAESCLENAKVEYEKIASVCTSD